MWYWSRSSYLTLVKKVNKLSQNVKLLLQMPTQCVLLMLHFLIQKIWIAKLCGKQPWVCGLNVFLDNQVSECGKMKCQQNKNPLVRPPLFRLSATCFLTVHEWTVATLLISLLDQSRSGYYISHSVVGGSAAVRWGVQSRPCHCSLSLHSRFFSVLLLCRLNLSVTQSSLAEAFLQYVLSPSQWMSLPCQKSNHVERSSDTLRTNSAIRCSY